MYCNTCGCEFAAGARYCSHCGRGVSHAASASSPRAPLERPRRGRKIAGVCLGLAQNLNLDVNLVRVLWVVVTLLFAVVFGLVAYAVAWVLIPEEPAPAAAAAEPLSRLS